MEQYNIDDEIFKFAYTMAFRDATLHIGTVYQCGTV